MFLPAIAYVKAKGAPPHTTYETNTTKRWQQSKRLRNKLTLFVYLRSLYNKFWDITARTVFFFSWDGYLARHSTAKLDLTWRSINKPTGNQGRILTEAQLLDQRRNDKIQKSNNNSTSKADVMMNIPRQILALTPADWLTTWQSKDGAIINYISKYKFNTLFKEELEEAHTIANDEKTLFKNIKHSKVAELFRDSQITTNVQIAIKRMLKFHLGNSATTSDDDQYFSLVLGQDDHNPFLYSSEYISLLSIVFDKFYPGGFKLSTEEQKEIIEQFLNWMITNDPLNRTGTTFNNFKNWFTDICNTLIHVRTMLNDEQVSIEMAKTQGSAHTNTSDYSAFGEMDKKGLVSLGNTYATLPSKANGEKGEKVENAWIASDSSGSGSQSESDDFAFETYK